MKYAELFAAGVFVGGALSYLFTSNVLAEVKKVVADVEKLVKGFKL